MPLSAILFSRWPFCQNTFVKTIAMPFPFPFRILLTAFSLMMILVTLFLHVWTFIFGDGFMFYSFLDVTLNVTNLQYLFQTLHLECDISFKSHHIENFKILISRWTTSFPFFNLKIFLRTIYWYFAFKCSMGLESWIPYQLSIVLSYLECVILL